MSDTPAGCQHRDHPTAAMCHKLCDPGESLCPYHLLLAECDRNQQEQPKPAQTYKTPRGYRE